MRQHARPARSHAPLVGRRSTQHRVWDRNLGYYADTRLGFLAYLAIRQDARGQGLGAWLFGHVLDQVARDALALGGPPAQGLCWEVERPALAADEPERQLRARRIRFYERLGARLIEPIDFVAPPLRPDLPAVPYHLMFRALDAATALTGARLQAILETVLVHDYRLARDDPRVRRALAALEARGP